MYLPAVALTALVFTVAGALYYALFPELQVHEVETRLKAGGDILMVLREDERMIVETLVKHGGTYLQKDIRRETGMTRLKVHRAVARLAERGVVSVKRHGNTNRVELTPWLREKLKQR